VGVLTRQRTQPIGRRELPLDPSGSYRRRVRACLSLGVGMAAALVAGVSCQTVDPGPNYVLPTIQFSANYFYCVVEPQMIMGGLTGHACGDDGNGNQGCHYSDKVPEMTLIPLPQPVTCSGSGTSAVPTDPTQTAEGTPANINLGQVSTQMSTDYTNAPIYLWPSQQIISHPVQVFCIPPNCSPPLSAATGSAVINILSTWATTQ
jgi:hypothetical protein